MALLKYRDYDKYVLRFFYETNEAVHRSKIYDKIKEYTKPSDEDLELVKKVIILNLEIECIGLYFI